MNCLAQTVVLAAVLACGLAIDWKKPCELQAKCMQDAVAQRKQCDTLTANRNAKWPPKLNEAQNRSAEHAVVIAGLDYAKRNYKIDCLQKSLANATIVSCTLAKIASCEAILNSYTPRSKRDAPADNQAQPDGNLDHPRPDENQQHEFHAGSEPQEERRKRQANTTTTQSAAAAAKAKAAADRAAAAAKAREDKKARNDLNALINKCWADAKAIDDKCGRLAGCCSENWLCDLAYLNSDLVKEYGQKQRDYQLEHRIAYPPSCPAPPAPKPAIFANAGSGSGLGPKGSGSGAGPR